MEAGPLTFGRAEPPPSYFGIPGQDFYGLDRCVPP